jgi:hypothetical protein
MEGLLQALLVHYHLSHQVTAALIQFPGRRRMFHVLRLYAVAATTTA